MFWHIKVRRAQTSVPQCICPNINFYLSGHCFSCSLTEISDGQTMSMASHKLLCHWFHTFWKTISHWLTARLYITCQMNKYLFNNPTKYNQLKEFFFLLPQLFAKNDLVEKISANFSTGKDRDRQAYEQIPLSKFHKFWRTTIWWPWYQARRRQGFDLSGINQLAYTSPTAGAKQLDGQRWIFTFTGKTCIHVPHSTVKSSQQIVISLVVPLPFLQWPTFSCNLKTL